MVNSLPKTNFYKAKIMSKKDTYFYILAAAIIIIAIGFFMKIGEIQHITNETIAMLHNPVLVIAAAVCAFIFITTGSYWLIMLGCAIAASLAVQYLQIGHGAGLFTIAVRAFAFLVVVYLLNLIKVVLGK